MNSQEEYIKLLEQDLHDKQIELDECFQKYEITQEEWVKCQLLNETYDEKITYLYMAISLLILLSMILIICLYTVYK